MPSVLRVRNGKVICGYVSSGGEDTWPHCCICDGRIHLPGCSARMNKDKDCCAARHRMLYEQGQTRGLGDSSMYMWSEDHPGGYHPNDVK